MRSLENEFSVFAPSGKLEQLSLLSLNASQFLGRRALRRGEVIWLIKGKELKICASKISNSYGWAKGLESASRLASPVNPAYSL